MIMAKPVYILGLTGFLDCHDNSAVLVKDGEVVFAVSEERLTRKKHDASFPINAIEAALKWADIGIKDVEYLVSGWPKQRLMKIFLKPHLIGDLAVGLTDLGINAHMRLVPLGLMIIEREKVATRKPTPGSSLEQFFTDRNLMGRAEGFSIKDKRRLAQSKTGSVAFRNSGFKECLAVTLDGFGATPEGDLRSGSVWLCKDGEMKEVKSVPIEASMGLYYEAVTVALGFKPADGEGKTMGLAVYGDPVKVYRELKRMAPRFENGKWIKNPLWLNTIFSVDLKYKSVFERTRMGRRLRKLISQTSKQDVAAAAQRVLEEEVEKFVIYLHNKYKQDKIAASGGVFLNVKMNKKIRQLPVISEIFVYPHAGDGGVAVGAALEIFADEFTPLRHSELVSESKKIPDQVRNDNNKKDFKRLQAIALGVEFSSREILTVLKQYSGQISYRKQPKLSQYVAKALAEGRVIGWFQGREEWGPRALGQRSVLADPRDEKMRKRINDLMKKRDWFMPFAPAVMEEYVRDWFMEGYMDPFMTMAFDVVKGKEKLIPAAIHVDNTARPQVVSKKVNPKYWQVINEFYKLTRVPVILNTSFNKHGLPIVHSPAEAIEHLLWGCVDELAIGDYLAKKA
jgi:carbamoyltransferase